MDYEYVSSVLHNRLKDKKNYPKFECDVTLQYYFRHVEGARHAELTAEDLLIDSQYNTRKKAGYTPGPICSPSLTAIKAALYPASTKYTFFISLPDGYNIYATSYAQHELFIGGLLDAFKKSFICKGFRLLALLTLHHFTME